MPVFFTSGDANNFAPVGRAIGCEDEHTQGTTTFVQVSLPEEGEIGQPQLTWSSERSIITRMTVSHQCNFQFLHTVGNDIFIYVFGDRVGQITISGLSMTRDCHPSRISDSEHGFEKILKWYRNNRVANRKEPVRITIGKTPIDGFVVSLTGDVVDPSTRLMQYGLTMMVLPEKT